MVLDRLDATTYPTGHSPAEPALDETLQGVLQRVDPEHALTRPEETFIFSEYDQRLISACGQYAAGILVALARAAIRQQVPEPSGCGTRVFPVSVRTLAGWAGLAPGTVQSTLKDLEWFVSIGPQGPHIYSPRTLSVRVPFPLLAADQLALYGYMQQQLRGQPFKHIRAQLRVLGQLPHRDLVEAVLPPRVALTLQPDSMHPVGQTPMSVRDIVALGLGLQPYSLQDLEGEIRLLATALQGTDIPVPASLVDDWMPNHGPMLVFAWLELQRRRQSGQLDAVINHADFAVAIGASDRLVRSWAQASARSGKPMGGFAELEPFVSDLQLIRGGFRLSGLYSRVAMPAVSIPEPVAPLQSTTATVADIPVWIPSSTGDYADAVRAITLEWEQLRPLWERHTELKGGGQTKVARREYLAQHLELLPSIAIELLLSGLDQPFLLACRNLLDYDSPQVPRTNLPADVRRAVQLGPALTLDVLQRLASPDIPDWEPVPEVRDVFDQWTRRAKKRRGTQALTLAVAAQALIADLGLVAVGEDMRQAQLTRRERRTAELQIEWDRQDTSAIDDERDDLTDPEAERRQALWEAVLAQLRLELRQDTFHAYFPRTVALEWSTERVLIQAETEFHHTFLETRMQGALRRLIRGVDERAGKVAFCHRTDPAESRVGQLPMLA